MISYEEYLNKLKGSAGGQPDYARLRAALEQRLAGQRTAAQKWKLRAALAGSCAVLLIGLSAYLVYPLWNNSDQLMSYVYGQQEIADGPVIEYVFAE